MTSVKRAILIAAGRGKRLGAHTDEIPKSMVEVAGKPFIVHQLALLASAGIERVVLCLGHLGEQVQELLGARHAGIEIVYSMRADCAK